jgi:hypothetical protein
MAKSTKKKQEKKEQQQPLKVNGSFMDILKASGKHANNNSQKKKNEN